MGPLSVKSYVDTDSFAAEAMPFLMSSEIENQIVLGMLNNPAGPPAPFEFLFTVTRNGKVVGAATKNQGDSYKLILSPMDRECAAKLAHELKSKVAPTLRGVLGPSEVAEIFANDWGSVQKVPVVVQHRQGILSCSEITSNHVTQGDLKIATNEDLDLMLEWRRHFVQDCGLDVETSDVAMHMTKRIISKGSLLLWVVDNQIVSMANATVGTPNGGRIGLVYTPPHLRGRSYASALVALATERLLGTGKKFVSLYTDLANPISNRIYERMGYQRVADSVALVFERT